MGWVTWTPRDGVTILDGGLATQLEHQGHDLSGALWSGRLLRDDPNDIVAAHRAFLDAGAQIVTTASYQASFTGFANAGIQHAEAARLMTRSVALARRAVEEHSSAASQRAAVAASVGPYGAALADGSEYRGRYGRSAAQLRDWHARRIEVLIDSGADLLAIETIPDVDEAEAILGLLGETQMPAWLSFTIQGERTRAGQPLGEAFAVAQGIEQVVAVGVNCCDPRDVLPAIRLASQVSALPVVVYPNSGQGWDARTRAWTGTGLSLPQHAPSWVEADARIIGGCCQVTAAQIGAMRAALVADSGNDPAAGDTPCPKR